MNKVYRASSEPKALHRPIRPISLTSTKDFKTFLKFDSDPKASIFQMGSYEIDSSTFLGKGFCSKVYKALNLETKTYVALKLVDLSKIKSVVHKRFLKNEVKCLNQLKNTNHVINLIQTIHNKTQLALVFQLCQCSLADMMKDKNGVKQALPTDQALKIFEQATFGYLAMKTEGYVHRDIKPANILIGFDGKVRLADLGFATKESKIDEDRFVNAGSPLYMSPEVMKQNDYSSKGDIWALGVVLLEMLLGKLPWEDIKESELRKFILNLNISEILPKDLETKWKVMLLGCLEANPKKRMTALELIQFFKPDYSPNYFTFLRPGSKSEIYEQIPHQQIKEKIGIPTSHTQQSHFYQSHNNSSKKLTALKGDSFDKPLLEKLKGIDPQSLKIKKSFSSKKLASKPHDSHPNLLNLKLSQNHLFDEVVHKEHLSSFNLARLIFKILQMIQNNNSNLHVMELKIGQETYLLKAMALLVLQLFSEIKNGKSCQSKQEIQKYKKSRHFSDLVDLIRKYQRNYKEYFAIKFNLNSYQPGDIDIDNIVQIIKHCLQQAHNLQLLIFEEILSSKLNEIADRDISQFFILYDLLLSLTHNLSMKQKNPNIFIKTNQLQQLLKKETNILKLEEIKKIVLRSQL